MKKQIVTTAALLISFLAHANNPIEKLVAQCKNGTIDSESIQQISNVLKHDIEKTATYTDEVIITFKIRKGENHNKDVWQKIVSDSVDMMAKANEFEQDDHTKIESSISEFIHTSLQLSGDKTDIHGKCSMKLHTPENYASITYTN